MWGSSRIVGFCPKPYMLSRNKINSLLYVICHLSRHPSEWSMVNGPTKPNNITWTELDIQHRHMGLIARAQNPI